MSLEKRRTPFSWMNIFDDMGSFFLDREDRFSMPIDLSEEGDNYIIEANVPGVPKEHISIDVNQAERYIDIKVQDRKEKSEEKDSNGKKYLHRERYFGTYSRRIRFGTPISPSTATTELNDGILTITLPKAEEAKTVQLKLT